MVYRDKNRRKIVKKLMWGLLMAAAAGGIFFMFLTFYNGSDSNVAYAQKRLSELGYYSGEQDGLISEHLTEAVAAFQSMSGLPSDGKLGAVEYELLRGEAVYALPAEELLARAVEASEARGREERLAVAGMLINRIEAGRYPSTLSGVCMQMIGSEDAVPCPESLWAARRALEGCDLTDGSTEMCAQADGSISIITKAGGFYFGIPKED